MIGSLRRLVDLHIPEVNFWKRKPPAIPALDLGVLRNNNAMTKISGSKKAPQADRFIDWMRRVTRDIQRTPRPTRATYQQGEEVDPNSGWEKEMGVGRRRENWSVRSRRLLPQGYFVLHPLIEWYFEKCHGKDWISELLCTQESGQSVKDPPKGSIREFSEPKETESHPTEVLGRAHLFTPWSFTFSA